MHVKKIEEDYLKLEMVIDKMYEQFIVNLETDSDNSSSDKLTSDRETSGGDPLDEGSTNPKCPVIMMPSSFK
jgi:hypothetical protein